MPHDVFSLCVNFHALSFSPAPQAPNAALQPPLEAVGCKRLLGWLRGCATGQPEGTAQ